MDAQGPVTHMRRVADFLDFQTLVRPGSPNTFLLAPEGLCAQAEPDEISPVFAEAPEALHDHILSVLSGVRDTEIVVQDRPGGRIQAVATTDLMRFKDDMDIQILAVDRGHEDTSNAKSGNPASQLAIYSRSRVGYSDMGANAKRVRSLVKKLGAA